MQIKFTEDTPVNNGIFKKGEQASFTKDVAESFIGAGKAVEVKIEEKTSNKKPK